MDLTRAVLLGAAALVAGAINAVAGGGTLISFPAAIAAGLSPLVANATNAVALTPASLGSAWGYRRELARDRHVLRVLLLPSLLGGAGGSVLLLVTPQRLFDAAVPGLVLLATLLLLWQNLRRKPAARPAAAAASVSAPVAASASAPVAAAASASAGEWQLPRRAWVVALLQFLVSLYGGYFGAGMGIMMLALFSMLGGGVDIHRMNGIKTVLAGLINGVAAIEFIAAKAVDPEATLIMAGTALIGGIVGAVLARRVNPATVRWAVVAFGLVLTATLAWKRFSP